jgi:hypothetical protein
MKKYIIGAVAGAIIATTISAYADEGLEKIEAYVRKGLPITLNGSQVTLESPAVIVDGSTYLKLRDVAKLTGLVVEWDESTQTVKLSNGAKVDQPTQPSTPVQNGQGNGSVGVTDKYAAKVFIKAGTELVSIFNQPEHKNTFFSIVEDSEYTDNIFSPSNEVATYYSTYLLNKYGISEKELNKFPKYSIINNVPKIIN